MQRRGFLNPVNQWGHIRGVKKKTSDPNSLSGTRGRLRCRYSGVSPIRFIWFHPVISLGYTSTFGQAVAGLGQYFCFSMYFFLKKIQFFFQKKSISVRLSLVVRLYQ